MVIFWMELRQMLVFLMLWKRDVSPAILAILRISSVEKLRISRDELSLMSTQIILSWISLKRVPWYLQWKPPSQIQPRYYARNMGKFLPTPPPYQKNVCFLKSVWNCHLSYHLFLSIKNAPFCEDLPHDVTTLTPRIGHRLPWRIWSFFLAHTTRCCYSLSFQQPKLEAETREGLWISMDFRVIGWGRDANLPWNCRYFLDANRNILPYRMQLFRVKQLHEEELIQRLWRSYYSVLYVHTLESFFSNPLGQTRRRITAKLNNVFITSVSRTNRQMNKTDQNGIIKGESAHPIFSGKSVSNESGSLVAATKDLEGLGHKGWGWWNFPCQKSLLKTQALKWS